MRTLRDKSWEKRFEAGIKPAGSTVLGYKWEGKNPNKYVVIDQEPMVVVKFLFENNKKKLKIKDKINKIGNEILYKNLKEIESLL